MLWFVSQIWSDSDPTIGMTDVLKRRVGMGGGNNVQR